MKTRGSRLRQSLRRGRPTASMRTGLSLDLRTGAAGRGARRSHYPPLSARMRRERRTATRLQGARLRRQGGLFEQESSPPATASTVAAARPLLAGASSVGTKYLRFQQRGSSAAVASRRICRLTRRYCKRRPQPSAARTAASLRRRQSLGPLQCGATACSPSATDCSSRARGKKEKPRRCGRSELLI
jgi:hypothetical protein